ncbi:MAG: tetratricopeptide repeat protein [bacterium]
MDKAHEKAVYHYNLGVQYEKENNVKEAKAEYKKALEADSTFPYPYRAIGEIFYREGNLDDALRELTTALKLDPGWVEVMALIAEVYYEKGDLGRAIQQQEKALQSEPNNIQYNVLMGRMLITDERYSDAIEILSNARKIDEGNFLLHYNLGVAFGKRAMADLDVSIEHWKKARQLKPDDPQVHRNVGIAFFTKGLLEEAAESFRKALSLDPSDSAARKFLRYAENLRKSG